MNVITISSVVLCLFFSLLAENPSQKGISDDTKFIHYLAGINLLEHSTNLSEKERAEKYRELCLITGLNADSAVQRINQSKNKPEQWNKVRASIKNRRMGGSSQCLFPIKKE
jgi:hypothetical protein